jgi:hypothetical protein
VVKWCKARAQALPCSRRTGQSRWRFAVVCGEVMTSRTLQRELAALYAGASIAMAAHNCKVRTVGDRLAQAIGKWEAQPRHRRGRLLQPSASAAEKMQGQGWQRVCRGLGWGHSRPSHLHRPQDPTSAYLLFPIAIQHLTYNNNPTMPDASTHGVRQPHPSPRACPQRCYRHLRPQRGNCGRRT